jgi:osmotically-inducible protein OsmY
MIQRLIHATDENLREVILAVLAADNQTAGTDLRVGVLNGIAHLAGKVDSLATREAAEQLVKQVSSIRGVVNRIEAPGAPSPSRTVNLDFNRSKEDERIDQ